MRTPYIVTIIIREADVIKANKVLADLGLGDNNFNIDATTRFVFCAPLQQWQYDRIIAGLDAAGVTYKHYQDDNDDTVKRKLESNLTKESLIIRAK